MSDERLNRSDPDDTEGRVLYRKRANALARAQIAYAKRRVRLVPDALDEGGDGG